MASPTMTFGQTLHSSASLGASGTASDTVDLSTKYQAQIMYKVTAGGTVAATFGVRIDIYGIYLGSTYGDSSTGTPVPNYTFTVTNYAASQVVYSPKIFLDTGRWKIVITNLDATNAITVEALYDTVDTIA